MKKIFIVGNPNTGKSTLFNNLTKSDEHTGNWHGVTVDVKLKKITIENQELEVYDLPGLYSLNPYSFEEEVTIKTLKENPDAKIIYILDANSMKRNMFLLMQLIKLNYDIKVCINNYQYFEKHGGKLDVEKLSSLLGCECIIFDAKKDRADNTIFEFKKIIRQNYEFSSTKECYKRIDEILFNCSSQPRDYIYGYSKYDKILLQPLIFVVLFLTGLFFALYLIFFLIGPTLSNGITFSLNSLIRLPVSNLLAKITNNNFILSLFNEGIASACFAVCSFLPQVCLLYVFLTMLENSGLISRFAFLCDDFLNKLGLNGKCVYTMLMGFGCNTTATVTAKNMPDKNSRIKTVLITPFMSCTAKLPIYLVIISALFKTSSIWIVALLYILGIIVAFTLAFVLEKTYLPSKSEGFLIEFPPLKMINFKDTLKTSFKSSKNFIKKVFGIIVMMSVIVWLLSNVTCTFRYCGDYSKSILYNLSEKLYFIFKPLGFNSPAIICTLIVGLVAKEMILSTMMIFNHVSTIPSLAYSLTDTTSVISLTLPTAVSFLIFILLYTPCVSNIAVMLKEIGNKYTIYGLIQQLIIAYLMSFIAYSIFSFNFVNALLGVLILIVSYFFMKKFARQKRIKCVSCINCKDCC